MDKKRIDVISLGCSKNLVDSERLLKQLELSGFQAFHNSDNVDGDIVIIRIYRRCQGRINKHDIDLCRGQERRSHKGALCYGMLV